MKIINNHYQLSGGVDPLALCEKYGTPLYVYDAHIMERQYKRLRDAFQVPDLSLNFACKALTNISVIKFLKQLGAGIDCVSIQEVQIAIAAGYQPKEILFTPSGVSIKEIEAAIEIGVHINADNIPLLEELGKRNIDAPLCIRINPHVMAGGNEKISVGHIESKFGISHTQIPQILEVVKRTGLTIEGLHIHTGSDIYNIEAFLEATEVLMNLAMEFPDLTYLNFGSGFKVPYQAGDKETDIEAFGAKFSERFNRFCEAYGRTLSLHFEPGKFLVSEAGYFLVPVNVVKTAPTKVFLGVDSGQNHIIRPMFYDAYHKITNLSNPNGTKEQYSVVGYICETDTLGTDRMLSSAKAGDILAIHNAGAYCYSMSNNYNSRFRPAEVMVYEGKDYLVRQRETMEDLLRTQTQVDVFAKAIA